ncbi:hypothetical protein RvY_11669 [Ramazzottius varieornatus]|uniref:Uncharacterized protein n=1 Tax=Ramazzottius varieornatus TaxID=947166 RepID=A0A1D1VIX8_RAMVA|nr:hypothetical protein RvY_11669 [Ramazzottius varieornatus]
MRLLKIASTRSTSYYYPSRRSCFRRRLRFEEPSRRSPTNRKSEAPPAVSDVVRLPRHLQKASARPVDSDVLLDCSHNGNVRKNRLNRSSEFLPRICLRLNDSDTRLICPLPGEIGCVSLLSSCPGNFGG